MESDKDPPVVPMSDEKPAAGRPRVPARGRHAVSVARIGLKRIAVPVSAARSSTTAPASSRPRAGLAQPCDRTAWSRGLYGVFLPDRRQAQAAIPFACRRV